MMIKRLKIPFDNQMSRTQTILGWVYLAVHVLGLPLLLALYAQFAPTPMSEARINMIVYVIGVAVVLAVFWRYLRAGFDVLLDQPLRCLAAMLSALLILYALNWAMTLALLLLPELPENPNNAAIEVLTARDRGEMMAMGIFLAPIVEEVLFRGVVFGSLRTRSRGLAYVVGVALFSIYHVWLYALGYGDASLLLYALQYVPVSIAVISIYERSGSIWPGIFFHMGYNALAFALMDLLA